MKITVRGLVIAVAVAGVLTAIIVGSGIVPAKASSGHWPITTWILEFAMERSVSTNSRSITSPELGEAMLIQGAGHYEKGCRWCHGGPQSRPARVVQYMTPPPSNLNRELQQWSAEQLFYIVRHGVLFTGMPAWPAEGRDDEVWGVVAFLKRFNQLTPAEYDQLAGIDQRRRARQALLDGAELPEVVVERCVSCHAMDGRGRSAFPVLAGQKRAYLVQALRSYRAASRPSGTMGPLAAELTDDEIDQAATYYSQLSSWQYSSVPATQPPSAGQMLAERGDASRRVGACQSCHPITATESREVAEQYPHLAGQHRDYLIGQLRLFRQQTRGGGDRHHLMDNLAHELTDQQIADVAAYYSQR